MECSSSKFVVDLEFSAVRLPPVRDVLVLGRKYPQGKEGVMAAFRFVAPDEFDMFDEFDDDEAVEAVLINRRIIKRIPAEDVIVLLRNHVFPYISPGEAINVTLGVRVVLSGLEISRQP